MTNPDGVYLKSALSGTVNMEFVNESVLAAACYENRPFPHTVIDNFLQGDKVTSILGHINALQDNDAESKFINPGSPYEYNKYAFNTNYGEYLKQLFVELNSPAFIAHLERLTGIHGLITGDITLRGAGIHRIRNGGYLQNHTDFNTYESPHGVLDRRLNLLIYMNPNWKDEYNGSLSLVDKQSNQCIKKISPVLNRCVIFNTSNKSIHGHPEPLNVPYGVCRQSIAVYYYTRNSGGGIDYEGDPPHSTLWYSTHTVQTHGPMNVAGGYSLRLF